MSKMRNKILQIGDNILNMNQKPVEKWDWCILGVVVFGFLITECYMDIIETYTHSLAFIEAIADGKFLQAYDYAEVFIREFNAAGNSALYPFPIYLIFGIWNLPIWVLNKLVGINVYHPLCLFWCKLLLVLFAIGCLYQIREILREMDFAKEKINFALFLFASSLFFALPVFVVAQYDVLAVFFILWGFEVYLKNNKITTSFLAIFAVAITMKMFAVFLFIPLVFLKEKRILRSVWYIATGVIPVLICGRIFQDSMVYREGTYAFYTMMQERLLGTLWPGGNTGFSIFIFVWVLLCIFAYACNLKSKEEYFKYSSWMGCAVFFCFFCFAHIHPYWLILCAPFIVFLIIANEGRIKLNIILEFFLTGSATLFYALIYDWVYLCNRNMKWLLMGLLGIQATEERKFSDYWNAWVGDSYVPTICAIFMACCLAMLIINFPKRTEKLHESNTEISEHIDHGMIYLKLLVLIGYFTFDVLLYIWR